MRDEDGEERFGVMVFLSFSVRKVGKYEGKEEGRGGWKD